MYGLDGADLQHCGPEEEAVVPLGMNLENLGVFEEFDCYDAVDLIRAGWKSLSILIHIKQRHFVVWEGIKTYQNMKKA